MHSESGNNLVKLINSLNKGEKRFIKLYAQQKASQSDDIKAMQLFDFIEKAGYYNEAAILKQKKSLSKAQLPNLKARLYQHILESLRQINKNNYLDIRIHQQLDYARLLYQRGLPQQSLKLLKKVKQLALDTHQLINLAEAELLEKKIRLQYLLIEHTEPDKVPLHESNLLTHHLGLTHRLANLSMKLYAYYLEISYVRTEKEANKLKQILEEGLQDIPIASLGFYEQVYLYQSYCWYYFTLRKYILAYKYVLRLTNIFEKQPFMKEVEAVKYLRGIHNTLLIQIVLRHTKGLINTINIAEKFAENYKYKSTTEQAQYYTFIQMAKLSLYALNGHFSDGIKLVLDTRQKLKEYEGVIDERRKIVFYYRMAYLYFGNKDWDNTINCLNFILQWKAPDKHSDVPCYARLLHLIVHYEMGNTELLQYLTKSVYRFMIKMDSLDLPEQEILHFLRRSFDYTPKQIKDQFKILLTKMQEFEKNFTQYQIFRYIDIVPWLESKLYMRSFDSIIQARNK